MRSLLRKAAVVLVRRRAVRRALEAGVRLDPTVGVETLSARATGGARLSRVKLPEELRGFEDLAFLFTSGQLNFGVVLLAFDEAAYLYRLARGLADGATVAEIGRYKGGSTLLLAAALGSRGEVWSYDLHAKLAHETAGATLDEELRQVLARFGLADSTRLIVGDSTTAPAPSSCDLVFVDGDHYYEGVRGDYERWRELIPPGGHLVFHDASARRPLATRHEGVSTLLSEIVEADREWFAHVGGAGSLEHFVRTDAPAPWSSAPAAVAAQ